MDNGNEHEFKEDNFQSRSNAPDQLRRLWENILTITNEWFPTNIPGESLE